MSDPRETLARIRAQADAATEGPWELEFYWDDTTGDEVEAIMAGGAKAVIAPPWYRQGEEGIEVTTVDAEFIAAARTDVPWLLEQVELRDKALEAVLELHRPVGEEVIPWDCAEGDCDHEDDEHPLDTVTLCGECYRLAVEVSPYYGENGCSAVLWPCPTVKAITDALDGGTDAPR